MYILTHNFYLAEKWQLIKIMKNTHSLLHTEGFELKQAHADES